MATTTSTLGLTKPALTDNADIAVINTNMDLIDAAVATKETPTGAQSKATTAQTTAQTYADTKDAAHLLDYVRQPGYALDSGTTNHLVVTLSPAPSSYVDGMGLAVKVKYASTATSDVNVNGLGVKAVYDAFGNAVTNFRANTTYSLKYESVSGTFIVQGKGGGGNATATQLLLGATAATDTGPITGTMPNNGAVLITPSASIQPIAAGYHNGSGTVAAVVITGSASNILIGTSVGGVNGTMPDDGAVTITPSGSPQPIVLGYHNGSGSVTAVTVPAANVLTGTTIAGTAGTMPENGPLGTYVPSSSPQSIPAGHTSGGTVAAVTVPVANVLSGTTIAGQAGSMVNRGAVALTPSNASQAITVGYHNGSGTVAAVSFTAGNVLSGTTIAGTPGTMPENGAVAITPSTATQTIVAGHHNGSGTVAGDVDLVAANIKAGSNIFNVLGTAPIPSGTAIAANVLSSFTFSNISSVGLTGTMANNGAVAITPSTGAQTIALGYHNGSGSVAGSASLIASNIRTGANIFGVAGNVIAGKRMATGTVTSGSSTQTFYTGGGGTSVSKYGATISGLAFTTGMVLLVDCAASTSVSMTVHLNRSIKNMSYASNVDTLDFQYNDTGAATYTITSFYTVVDGTTVTLPVPFASKSYWWIAYEY